MVWGNAGAPRRFRGLQACSRRGGEEVFCFVLICFLRIIVGFENLVFVGHCLLCPELYVPKSAFGIS